LPKEAITRNIPVNPVVLKRKKKSISVNRKKSNPDLKAMILAAGLGTRLMPLTAGIPKALVSINGVTLLEIAIRKLAREGFHDIIVNVHHHAGQVIEFINKNQFQGVNVSVSDESGLLLDTGGAILKARWFLDGKEPFLVHNVDIISDLSLQSVLTAHMAKGGLATLSVSHRQTKRYFLFDNILRLRGWTDTSSGEIKWAGNPVQRTQQLAFNGIHIINPEIFSLIKEEGKFSIINTYLELANDHPIYGHVQAGKTWFDLGKPDQLDIVASFLKDHQDYFAN
jgi:MurNAc alpha-1-phosphate uridylyltransferase